MKISHYLIGLFILALCGGCFTGATKKQKREIYYFDLQTFFKDEIVRLNKANPEVIKTVWHNNQSENKQVKISDWSTELSLFTESDINKTAFENSYHKDSTATKIIYNAKNKDLKTQRITIYLQNQKPIFINIINQQNNYLFKSWENLKYYPQKAYIINKKQKLLFWEIEVYEVKGEL